MFVDGTFTEGGGEPLATINPATGKVLAEIGTASSADVEHAVRAARRAYDRVWSRMPGAERAKYLFRIARLVQERSGELAVLESLDTGRPIRDSRERLVPAAAAHVFHHAGWADKLAYAGYGPDPRPLGVTGQIIGPDTALLTAAGTIAPALACGNTVVLKPAESTPLTALVLAEICQQADLP
ncbi:MAG: aldehyde dehydrogenase family protein, partial [Actinomycetes bacterium]